MFILSDEHLYSAGATSVTIYLILHLQLLGQWTENAQLEELEASSFFKQHEHPTIVAVTGKAQIESTSVNISLIQLNVALPPLAHTCRETIMTA